MLALQIIASIFIFCLILFFAKQWIGLIHHTLEKIICVFFAMETQYMKMLVLFFKFMTLLKHKLHTNALITKMHAFVLHYTHKYFIEHTLTLVFVCDSEFFLRFFKVLTSLLSGHKYHNIRAPS